MNSKIRVNILFPFLTLSGYGRRSLDLLRALIELKWDEWDFHIASLRFGQSPFIQLDTTDPINAKIMSRTFDIQQVLSAPGEIGIFCTVPSELIDVRIAKYQILFTAGIESTVCSPEFIKGYNNMDLVITSSEHAMNVFKNTTYQEKDQQGRVIGDLKINKPGRVLFEGVDLSTYDRKNTHLFDFPEVKENWNFLVHGMLLPGDFTSPYGHDRKNILTTIKVFLEAFKNKKNPPGLILKVNAGNYSVADRERVFKKIGEVRESVEAETLPNVYLIHGQLTDDELIGLYQSPKVKAMLSVAAEGWGRAPIEFSCATSKPLVVAPYGGTLDYINREFVTMVGGSLQQMHPSARNQFLIENSQIFYPDINQFIIALRDVYENYSKHEQMGKRQAHHARSGFSLDKMKEKLSQILKESLPVFSIPQPLVLPKLRKAPPVEEYLEAIPV